MALFSNPTTVSQAIAPFAKVKTNLQAVVKTQTENREAAERRRREAVAAAERAEAVESANVAAATSELDAAERLIAKLDALLDLDGDGVADVTPEVEADPEA